MENGVVTVLYFFAERRGRSLKSFHDFWDTLFLFVLKMDFPVLFSAIFPCYTVEKSSIRHPN